VSTDEKVLREWLAERRSEYPSILDYELDFEQVLSLIIQLRNYYKECIENCVDLIDWPRFFEMHPEIRKAADSCASAEEKP
jgi:hypothetical protein